MITQISASQTDNIGGQQFDPRFTQTLQLRGHLRLASLRNGLTYSRKRTSVQPDLIRQIRCTDRLAAPAVRAMASSAESPKLGPSVFHVSRGRVTSGQAQHI